jgi:hypothetical protein
MMFMFVQHRRVVLTDILYGNVMRGRSPFGHQ